MHAWATVPKYDPYLLSDRTCAGDMSGSPAATDERALLHLPPELIELILGELCSDDLLHAATTCNDLFFRVEAAAALGMARVTAQIPSSWNPHAGSQGTPTKLHRLHIMEKVLRTYIVQVRLRKQSAIHMRNMLRLYLSSIAHARACLGDECFEARRVAMTPGRPEGGVKVQVLKGTTNSSAMLIGCLEHGVFRALDDENLESFQIVLSEDAESTRIIETWTVRGRNEDGTMLVCALFSHPGSARCFCSAQPRLCRATRLLTCVRCAVAVPYRVEGSAWHSVPDARRHPRPVRADDRRRRDAARRLPQHPEYASQAPGCAWNYSAFSSGHVLHQHAHLPLAPRRT